MLKLVVVVNCCGSRFERLRMSFDFDDGPYLVFTDELCSLDHLIHSPLHCSTATTITTVPNLH